MKKGKGKKEREKQIIFAPCLTFPALPQTPALSASSLLGAAEQIQLYFQVLRKSCISVSVQSCICALLQDLYLSPTFKQYFLTWRMSLDLAKSFRIAVQLRDLASWYAVTPFLSLLIQRFKTNTANIKSLKDFLYLFIFRNNK